jgi:hypothetical protein
MNITTLIAEVTVPYVDRYIGRSWFIDWHIHGTPGMRIGKPFYACIPSHVLTYKSPCRRKIPFPFPWTLGT